MLRKEDYNKKDATSYIEHKTTSEKNELLFSYGLNFNGLPNWQKRGIGLYWATEEKVGYNPKDKVEVKVKRNVIRIEYNLPMREEYSNFIEKILEKK
jgi:tRNA(His) 5'-end guanylyltransferase